jgi:catechol 2,3-dioxygenase-like lactoylglutathione lyase family enzyme
MDATDHLTVFVSDYSASKRFYEEALAPLGLVVLLDWPDARRVYFGEHGKPSSLWVIESELAGKMEVALSAQDAGAVHSFYGTAIAAGARADREPGAGRESYSARIIDFDGNVLEAIFRGDTAALHADAAA